VVSVERGGTVRGDPFAGLHDPEELRAMVEELKRMERQPTAEDALAAS
jgi:hypothetical protein